MTFDPAAGVLVPTTKGSFTGVFIRYRSIISVIEAGHCVGYLQCNILSGNQGILQHYCCCDRPTVADVCGF